MSSEKTLTPQIRFKGFTEAWEQRKFLDFVSASGIRNSDNLELPSYSVTNDRGFIPQDEQFVNGGTMHNANKKSYWIVEPGSFAYNPARINVGSIGYQSTSENVIVSSLYEVFRTDASCNDRFLWHWLKTHHFSHQIEMLQEGGVRLYFFFDKLLQSEISMPSIDEQKKLGEQLDQFDNLITLHQRKLDALKKIKSALLEKMFPKDGSDIPEIRFTGFTEAWEQRKLGDIFHYLSSQIQASQVEQEGKYKLFDASSQIGYSNIGSDHPLVTIIKDGSGVGRIRLIPYKSWFIGTLGGLIPNEIDVNFGYALLQNFDFSVYVIGSTIPHIYFKDYSDSPLFISKYKEQQMIGGIFYKIDSLITLHQRKLDALKKIKSALLEKMFV